MRSTVFSLVCDFDSTLVSVETLELLARIALNKHQKKESVFSKIQHITKQGMEGKIPFSLSLEKRLRLFSAHKRHVEKLSHKLEKYITPSAYAIKDFFKKNAHSTYILSGGFTDYIIPTAKRLNILPSHIFANSFVYDSKGNITGVDTKNPLAHSKGKVQCIKSLRLPHPIIVIGDGYTDYEIRKYHAADYFIAFTENAQRKSVTLKADFILESFINLPQYIKMLIHK